MVGADFSSWDQPDGEELPMIRKESRAHAELKGEGGHTKDSLTSSLNSINKSLRLFHIFTANYKDHRLCGCPGFTQDQKASW